QGLVKEGQMNRLPENFIENKKRITDLLDEALRVHFEKARDAHTHFRDVLQTRTPPDAAVVNESRQRQDELIRQIDSIREGLAAVLGITKVAKELQVVIENRLVFKVLVDMVRTDYEDKLAIFPSAIPPNADPVALRT